MRKLIASLCVTALLALGVVFTAAAQTQIGDGLVVVQIDNVLNNNDVQVVVPVQVAAAIAANVCGVDIDVAVLGATGADLGTPFATTCDSASRAFNDGQFTITN